MDFPRSLTDTVDYFQTVSRYSMVFFLFRHPNVRLPDRDEQSLSLSTEGEVRGAHGSVLWQWRTPERPVVTRDDDNEASFSRRYRDVLASDGEFGGRRFREIRELSALVGTIEGHLINMLTADDLPSVSCDSDRLGPTETAETHGRRPFEG